MEEKNLVRQQQTQSSPKNIQFKDRINSVLELLTQREFEGAFRFDTLTQTRRIDKQLPWMNKKSKVYEKSDEARIIAAVQQYGIRKSANVRDAMDIIFSNNRYNPFIEYLESLDLKKLCTGEDPTVTFFQDYLGCEDNEYAQIASQMFFKAIIARQFHHTDFQYMIILTGAPKIGKDYTLKRVIPNHNWINTDFRFDLQLKNNVEHALGNVLCVMSDFDGFTDKEFLAFKAFLSNDEFTIRRPYRDVAEKIRLKCIFVATANKEDIVPDEPGNRRLLVLKCDASKQKKIPQAQLDDKTRDVLWAFAYKNYKENGKVNPGSKFDVLAEEERKKYLEQDPVKMAIEKWMKSDDLQAGVPYSALDVFNQISRWLHYPAAERSILRQISKVLSEKDGEFKKSRNRKGFYFTYISPENQ